MELTTHPQECLGFNIVFKGPKNVAELEAAVGKDAALKAYMLAYSYKRNAAMYPAICKKLEELTGEARIGVPATKADGTPKFDENGVQEKDYSGSTGETPMKYLNRIRTDTRFKDLLTDEAVRSIIEEVSTETGEWTATTVSDRIPAKAFYDVADKVLAKITAGQGTAEESTAKIEAKLGGSFQSMFGEFNRDNLARAAKAIDAKAREEAANDI